MLWDSVCSYMGSKALPLDPLMRYAKIGHSWNDAQVDEDVYGLWFRLRASDFSRSERPR